jgi:hypothetical protein
LQKTKADNDIAVTRSTTLLPAMADAAVLIVFRYPQKVEYREFAPTAPGGGKAESMAPGRAGLNEHFAPHHAP